MKRLCKLGSLILAVIIISLIVALPVLAYTYYATVSVANTSNTSFTMLPCIFSVNNSFMSTNGFMTATGLDTRVQTTSGTAKPHMVASDRTMFATVVPATSQTNLLYTTGNTALAQFYIIPGYDYVATNPTGMRNQASSGYGYMYTFDAAALEPGNNFSIEYVGYTDTAAGYGRDILYKEGAIAISSTQAGGNMAADVLGATAARDVGGISAGSENVQAATWWAQTFTAASTYWITSIDVDVTSAATAGTLYVAIYSSAANVPTGSAWSVTSVSAVGLAGVTNLVFTKPIKIVAGTDYAIVLAAPSADAAVAWARSGAGVANAQSVNSGSTWTAGAAAGQFVFQMYGTAVTTSVSTACSTGTHTVTVRGTGGGGNLGIKVDAAAEATVPIAAVPDTVNHWYWMRGEAYATSIKVTVAGTLIAWYQPVTMIIGTTLPDREGAAQNGTFAYGPNPVTVTLGSMVATGTSTGVGATPVPRDVLPAVGVSDWFGDGTVAGAILTNPIRPLVTVVSDNTTLTEIQVWRFYGLIILVSVTVWVALKLRGHQGITAIIASAIIIGLVALDHNIFPLWLLVLAIGGFVGGLIAERSPSL